MKYSKYLLAIVFSFMYIPILLAASPAGTWTTIDDATGKKRSIVRLSVSGGTLNGTIVKVFPQPGDTGICAKCPGDFKDKKIEGLRFLWGLKESRDGEWDGGKILDPKTGKIYNAKISVKGDKLHVRGYVGVAALGKTQVWVKS